MAAVDGIHDLGGREGFGPVVVEADEPPFHEAWEGRVFAAAAGGLGAGGFNTPMFRHAIERMDPAHYLASGYYEHWLTGVTTLLVAGGLIDLDDLVARAGSFPLSRPVSADADDLPAAVRTGGPRFAVGDEVRARDVHFRGHTRCPGYVRGRRGVVVRVDDDAPVAELEAHRGERVLDGSYCVRFTGTELWGDDADEGAPVHVDLCARYLEPA